MSLKEKLVIEFKLPEAKQRLVFKGHELCDDFSLRYYGIQNHSIIFLTFIKSKRPIRPKASDLFRQLQKLMNEFHLTSSCDFQSKIDEIIEIIDHPVMKAHSNLNNTYMRICDDARELVENARYPISEKTLHYIAQTQDLTLMQFESTIEGIRLLQSISEEEEELRVSYYEFQQNTNLDFNSTLSTTPLPDPWMQSHRVYRNGPISQLSLENRDKANSKFMEESGDSEWNESGKFPANLSNWVPRTPPSEKMRQQYMKGDLWPEEDDYFLKPSSYEYPQRDLKEIYAPQVTQLKKMGFKDEDVIVEALAQTDGNVQMAALILQSRFQSEC